MQLVIKKYKNRKLYNPEISSYVTLSDIEKLVKERSDLKVINEHGVDITGETLLQAIASNAKNSSNVDLLKRFIISGSFQVDTMS